MDKTKQIQMTKALDEDITPEINYDIKLEILTSADPEGGTWADMGVWAKNVTQALNEVLYQANYYKDKGWGSTEVTGGQYTLTLTGDRKIGDPACDYIFDKERQYKFGAARKTQIRITRGTDVITWNVTLANITDSMGDANQPNAVSVTIHGNGAPEFSTVGG